MKLEMGKTNFHVGIIGRAEGAAKKLVFLYEITVPIGAQAYEKVENFDRKSRFT